MRSFLTRVNGDIPNVESVTISCLTAIDPVSVCIVFENRWRAFLNTVILDPQGPVEIVIEKFVIEKKRLFFEIIQQRY